MGRCVQQSVGLSLGCDTLRHLTIIAVSFQWDIKLFVPGLISCIVPQHLVNNYMVLFKGGQSHKKTQLHNTLQENTEC